MVLRAGRAGAIGTFNKVYTKVPGTFVGAVTVTELPLVVVTVCGVLPFMV